MIDVTSLATCKDAVGVVIIIGVVVVIVVVGKTGGHTSSLDVGFLLANKQVGHVGTLVGVVHLLRKQPLLDVSIEYPLHNTSLSHFDLQDLLSTVKVM